MGIIEALRCAAIKRYIILSDYKIIDKLKYKISFEKDETDESYYETRRT